MSPESNAERGTWIASVLDVKTLPKALDFGTIAKLHLAKKKRQSDPERQDFQQRVGKPEGRVTFVKAGCGTGKTVAAYGWGETHCPGKRLYLCYPTTGTATEGFRDYLLDPELAEHVKTNLEHSRRRVDFDLMQADEDRNADVARIESLDLWRVPVVACTVDTVLGVNSNSPIPNSGDTNRLWTFESFGWATWVLGTEDTAGRSLQTLHKRRTS